MDHDQRFKTLIREFFADFMRLFLADWAARLDLSAIEWLDKEVFPDPPEGERHTLDLVAKVGVPATDRPSPPSLILVHVEIESPDRTTSLKSRFPYYYHFLRDKYHPWEVLPIALYMKVGLDGIGHRDPWGAGVGLAGELFSVLVRGFAGSGWGTICARG
ncbi:MAG: hypothetical protein ACK4RK_02960 [Gemmataceae bacterium]